MTGPLLRYGKLRARAGWNFLVRSGVPWPISLVLAASGALASFQFARVLGTGLGRAGAESPGAFQALAALALCAFQAVFTFVALGSISIRMFDPRKIAEVDMFAALPLRRVDRFLMQVSDVMLLPVGMVVTVIVPAMAIAAQTAGLRWQSAFVLVTGAALVALQPVPALVALYAFFLRAAPAALLRRRGLLFLLFALAAVPVVRLLANLLVAWKTLGAPPEWLPASWAATAMGHAEAGRWGPALALIGANLALVAALSIASYVAYDRAFMERFDEMLAKLQAIAPPPDADVVTGRERRGIEAPSFFGKDRAWAALLRKEVLGYSRDAALQITLAGMGAMSLTFALLANRDLAIFAVTGIAFLAVYLAACLGLASFSLEGRGFPVLAPLPLRVDEVLRAKLVVNTALLAAGGAAGGAAVAIAASSGVFWLIVLTPVLAIAGAAAIAPLGAIVTAMAALFPRRLQRTGRREISPVAMSFFTALTGLFYASLAASLAAPLALGARFLWIPFVVLIAWIFISAALVTAARKAVRLGRTEG